VVRRLTGRRRSGALQAARPQTHNDALRPDALRGGVTDGPTNVALRLWNGVSTSSPNRWSHREITGGAVWRGVGLSGLTDGWTKTVSGLLDVILGTRAAGRFLPHAPVDSRVMVREGVRCGPAL